MIGGETKIRITKRRIGLIGMLLTIIPIVALSFTPITGLSSVKVNEPLSVSAATVTGGTCVTTPNTFTCTSSVFASETGTVTVTVANAATSPILASFTSSSNSTAVTVVNPSPVTLAASTSTVVTYTFSVNASAPPQVTSMTFSVTR